MAALLAVLVMTLAVGLNVSFLRFYSESGLTGHDNIADIVSVRCFANRAAIRVALPGSKLDNCFATQDSSKCKSAIVRWQYLGYPQREGCPFRCMGQSVLEIHPKREKHVKASGASIIGHGWPARDQEPKRCLQLINCANTKAR